MFFVVAFASKYSRHGEVREPGLKIEAYKVKIIESNKLS
jgi:hypothetical protein